jgi:hypothetical protein
MENIYTLKEKKKTSFEKPDQKNILYLLAFSAALESKSSKSFGAIELMLN